jgi:hypothetical protein
MENFVNSVFFHLICSTKKNRNLSWAGAGVVRRRNVSHVLLLFYNIYYVFSPVPINSKTPTLVYLFQYYRIT